MNRAFAVALTIGVFCGSSGCANSSPPPSRFPDAAAALSRLKATFACSYGVAGEAKLDYFGSQGRVRANLLYITRLPDKLRLDIVSPFGATLSTLTANGKNFALLDFRAKQFVRGPANTCSLERWAHVPVPPAALVQLLRGEPPILVHAPEDARLRWEGGRYILHISSRHAAMETVEFVPTPATWQLPHERQELRVLNLRVEQQGVELYRAELEGHQRAVQARPRLDPEGIDPPIPVSGPACQAEVPRRVRFEVSTDGQDLLIDSREVTHNPPLPAGVFDQEAPPGVHSRVEACGR